MPVRRPKLQPEPPVASPAQTSDIVEAEAGGVLTIDLGAIVANWQRLASVTMPVETSAVVKANAYGCGIEPVVGALKQAGCKTFFVADLSEARRVRAVAPSAIIYVLNGLLPNTAQAYVDVDARPVINSLTELAEWDAFIASSQRRGNFALHIDTGINRLGITPEEAAALAPRLKQENNGIALIMSHLAAAETPDHPLNDKQVRLFRDIRLHFRGIPSSLANSSGIFLGPSAHCDLVRPGAALYGINPTPSRPTTMQPVIDLKGRIIQVRHVQRGDSVGYGATWTATKPGRIAVVAVGYGDGYPRSASRANGKPNAEVMISTSHCPLVGRISMDLLAVDVTDAPEGVARRGEMVTLIGGDIDVDRVAEWSGTIGYEILTNLGSRYHRVYK